MQPPPPDAAPDVASEGVLQEPLIIKKFRASFAKMGSCSWQKPGKRNGFHFGIVYDKYCQSDQQAHRENQIMSAPYLKANLITELATVVGISKRKTDLLLTQIAQIAYREARTGFVLPGICKLDVVHRNARRARIPRTGEQIIIGAHDSLRVRPLRKAKHAVTPMHPGLVQYVRAETTPVSLAAETLLPADDAPQTVLEPDTMAAAAPVQPAAAPIPAPPDPILQPNNAEGMVSFRCAACGQEMEAPFDMAGTASDCPACSGIIEVPYISEPGTIWGAPLPSADASAPSGASTPLTEAQVAATHDAMKSRTIRIELPDDI